MAEKEGEERILSRLHTVSTEPNTRSELGNREIITQAEIRGRALNQRSHPGAPKLLLTLHVLSLVQSVLYV